MNPVVEQAVRDALADWRREADGSRTMAEHYEREAERVQQRADREVVECANRVREHREDANRAAARVTELEAALREHGLEP